MNKKHLFLIFIFLFSISIFGDKSDVSTEVCSISLKRFVELAVENDPYFEKILYSNLYLKYNKVLNVPVDQLIMSLKGRYDVRFGLNDGLTSSVSLSRLFSDYGTRANFEYSKFALVP